MEVDELLRIESRKENGPVSSGEVRQSTQEVLKQLLSRTVLQVFNAGLIQG